MGGLSASKGPLAVLGISTFLDRLDALEKAPEREATRAADHAALATLERRGIDPEERARLRGLVERAQRMTSLPPEDPEEGAEDRNVERRLRQLRVWFEEWSSIARAVVDRRDDLIRLGLARRRTAARTAPAPESPASPNGATDDAP